MTEIIYVRVGDKLVPKSPNQREPGRRYRQVVTSDQTYLVEFTPDEETARDAEEAQWESERPAREAEELKRQHAFREYRNSIKYETRLCAFLDVLGWTNAIQQSLGNPELVRDLGILLYSFRVAKQMIDCQGTFAFPSSLQMTHFSDCVVVSAHANYEGKTELIALLKFLCSRLLRKGFLMRGGVAMGLLHHKQDSVFGPALVTAYKLEHVKARYPRILLEPQLAEAWWPGDAVAMKNGAIQHFKTWRKCWVDGSVFLDFLQPLIQLPGGSCSGLQSLVRSQLKSVQALIAENMDDPLLRPKYTWLAQYHNEIAKEYEGVGIEPLTLPQ
jgi:hypothetical protein